MITKTFLSYKVNILHRKKCFRYHGIVQLLGGLGNRNWSHPSIMGIVS